LEIYRGVGAGEKKDKQEFFSGGKREGKSSKNLCLGPPLLGAIVCFKGVKGAGNPKS